MIDFFLIIIYLVIAVALCAVMWSVLRTMKIVGKTSGKAHGIPVRRINIAICASIVIIMILSFIIGSTDPMHINAQSYNNTFWLRMSNMFVFTGISTITVAAIAMAYCFYIVEVKNRNK